MEDARRKANRMIFTFMFDVFLSAWRARVLQPYFFSWCRKAEIISAF
jgi:hypothetical protein